MFCRLQHLYTQWLNCKMRSGGAPLSFQLPPLPSSLSSPPPFSSPPLHSLPLPPPPFPSLPLEVDSLKSS